jgi:hypothetical protein
VPQERHNSATCRRRDITVQQSFIFKITCGAHMISVRDMGCGLHSVNEFPDSICSQLSLSTKAATVFILFWQQSVLRKATHAILIYKLHYHFTTNHKQTHAPTAWPTAATPIPMLHFQTYVTKQTYTCHLPYERPTLCWMHHLKRKDYQVSNLLKTKHNQCLRASWPHTECSQIHTIHFW